MAYNFWTSGQISKLQKSKFVRISSPIHQNRLDLDLHIKVWIHCTGKNLDPMTRIFTTFHTIDRFSKIFSLNPPFHGSWSKTVSSRTEWGKLGELGNLGPRNFFLKSAILTENFQKFWAFHRVLMFEGSENLRMNCGIWAQWKSLNWKQYNGGSHFQKLF